MAFLVNLLIFMCPVCDFLLHFHTYKSPDIDQITEESVKAGGETLRSQIHTHLIILVGIRKDCHSNGNNLLFYLFIKRMTKVTVIITEECHSDQLHTKVYPIFFTQFCFHT
jgi:hypothetical protein